MVMSHGSSSALWVPRRITLTGGNPPAEQTPATRQAAIQGDGRSPFEWSFGSWLAATNLRLNGGFETNATGWTATANAAVSRDTTKFKFGAACGKVVCNGVAAGEGVEAAAISVTVSLAYADSVWVFAPNGATLRLQLAERLIADATDITVTNTDFVGTGDWQRVEVLKTLGGTSVIEHVRILTVTSAQAITFWIDGAQLEQSFIATPYIETNGGTATRAKSVIRIPLGAAREMPSYANQVPTGWVAVKFRPQWAAAREPQGGAGFVNVLTIFSGTSSTLFYRESTDSWEWIFAGLGATRPAVVGAHAKGDVITLIVRWNPLTDGISLNGGTWVDGGPASVTPGVYPTGISVLCDESINSNRELGGEVLWVAAGLDALSQVDAVNIAAIGNQLPRPDPKFPPLISMFWGCKDDIAWFKR